MEACFRQGIPGRRRLLHQCPIRQHDLRRDAQHCL